MKNFINKYKNSITAKLLLYMLVLNLFMTLLITVINIYDEYSEGIKRIEYQFQQIRKISINSLTASLWDLYDEQLQIQLRGLLYLPDIEYLEIRSNEKLIVFAGKMTSEKKITVKIPMIYTQNNKKKKLVIYTLLQA